MILLLELLTKVVNLIPTQDAELSRVFDVLSIRAGYLDGEAPPPEAVDSVMILQNCFVIRLNLGCFFDLT